MFTGLIKDIGIIKSISDNKEGKVFEIETKLASKILPDDSVATNGVCLTAYEVNSQSFFTQAIHVTLEKTNLGALNTGSHVNLELALAANERLGGHIVQGHVNGRGKIENIEKQGKNWTIFFSTDEGLRKYIVKEGSIAIDGISLTVSHELEDSFAVSIIPHTFENTILKYKDRGDALNIEVDIMAKYIEKLMRYQRLEES